MADVTICVESLYPNCRFGNISGYLGSTIVTLHEGMAIWEDKGKVTVKSTVGRVSLVSDALEVVTIKGEVPEMITNIFLYPGGTHFPLPSNGGA